MRPSLFDILLVFVKKMLVLEFLCYCYSHTLAKILANVKQIIFAASGEYMANGLTNAIRHQFAMIAKWSPDIRIRGRSCGVANIMLLSHCGEYPCECKTTIFAANSPEMMRLPRRIIEHVRPFKWLRMLPNFLRIPANFLRSLRSVCRISCKSFANVKNTYECLTITTNALPSIRTDCDAYENNQNMIS